MKSISIVLCVAAVLASHAVICLGSSSSSSSSSTTSSTSSTTSSTSSTTSSTSTPEPQNGSEKEIETTPEQSSSSNKTLVIALSSIFCVAAIALIVIAVTKHSSNKQQMQRLISFTHTNSASTIDKNMHLFERRQAQADDVNIKVTPGDEDLDHNIEIIATSVHDGEVQDADLESHCSTL